MKNRILHVMVADKKFNLPLVNHIINNLKLENHRFLIVNYQNNCNIINHNIVLLKHPLRKEFLTNFFKFYKEVILADKIISHAAQLSIFFILIPRQIKKVIWFIHGGIDIPTSTKFRNLSHYLDLSFKRRVKFHAVMNEENSNIINNLLNSNATIVKTSMYLSNTIEQIENGKNFIYQEGFINKTVLLGNSNDPSNNHIEAFNILRNSGLKPSKIISILSYGMFTEYAKKVEKAGFDIFQNSFMPIKDFMPLKEYLNFLKSIDFVLFNHRRGEAMGVTVQLLSLGKPVFFNPESPTYKGFLRRGYKVFSIYDLELFKNINKLDLTVNKDLLNKEFNINVLNSFYINL